MDRERKAWEAMGYAFPADYKQTLETLKQLDADTIVKLQEYYNHQMKILSAQISGLLDIAVYSTCETCATSGTGWGDLPQGWSWIDNGINHEIMCASCQDNYISKFGEAPKIVEFE